MSDSNLSPAEVALYARQMDLEGWGRRSQESLKSSRVLVAGGGLAAAAAVHLLAAGVGALRLVDEGRVALADLSYQILFHERDLGKARALVAAERLREINPFAQVESHVKSLTESNLARLTSNCQVLVDSLDAPPCTTLLNRAAARFRVPLVYARAWGLDGQLTTFWPGLGPCFGCVGTDIDSPEAPGLLAPLPGLLGTLQALEALRILGSLGPRLVGRLISFSGKLFQFTEKPLLFNPQCPVCLPCRETRSPH